MGCRGFCRWLPYHGGCQFVQGNSRAIGADSAAARMKAEPGPPMMLWSAGAARVRLMDWCKSCGHRSEPDPTERARWHGLETMVLDWRAAGLLEVREPQPELPPDVLGLPGSNHCTLPRAERGSRAS